MTTKSFTIPPLTGDERSYIGYFLAGIDAVIALLREPDDATLDAMWRGYDSTDGESMRSVARTLADELGRRKP